MFLLRWARSLAMDTRPLRVAAFRRVFVGHALAVVGTAMTQVAVPVQVFSMTQSSLAVGLVSMAAFAPVVVLGLYGGALSDAVDRRNLYRVSTAVTWACTLGLLMQAILDLRSFWLVLLLAAIQASCFAMSSTVRGAIIPALVPRETLAGANALFYTVGTFGQVVGPLLAGLLLLVPAGTTLAYAVDALLFTAVLVAAWRLPQVPRGGARSRVPGLGEVLTGLRFIAGKPVLLVSFLVDIVAMTFAMPEALFPQAAAEQVHGGVGLLYGSIALGSVLMGLSSGWISRIRRHGLLLSGAAIVWAAAIAAAGLTGSLWTMSALLVLAGAADLVSAVCRQTILQTVVTEDMRGRLQGVYTVAAASGPRLGDFRAGAMAAGTTLTLAWSGSAVFAIGVILVITLVAPSYRRYQGPPSRDAS